MKRPVGIPPGPRRATKGLRHGFDARDRMRRAARHAEQANGPRQPEATAAYANALRAVGRSNGKRMREGLS